MPTTLEQLRELKVTVEAMESFGALIDTMVQDFCDSLQAGAKILTCGNGGSAADAMHLAEELSGRYRGNRRPLPGISLAADVTALTCIANDFGYDAVFERQVQAFGKKGDWLVVFSTSGNSPSIVRALDAANALGMTTLALLGKDGGACKGKGTYEIVIPSSNGARVQELHTWILHVMLEFTEGKF